MKKEKLKRLMVLLGHLEGNIHNDRNPDQKTDSLKFLKEAMELVFEKLSTMKP